MCATTPRQFGRPDTGRSVSAALRTSLQTSAVVAGLISEWTLRAHPALATVWPGRRRLWLDRSPAKGVLCLTHTGTT